MTALTRVDLHCHSTCSDGVLDPADLAKRAAKNGVQLWSLTDHDEVCGLPVARQTAMHLGIKFLTGIEISVTWQDSTLHMVGLNFDETNVDLNQNLCAMKHKRVQRAHAMADKLDKLGVPDSLNGAMKYVGSTSLLSRTHFARYLVDIGYCKHIQQVFDLYLGDGKPAFESAQWATLPEAVDWVHNAGGVCVIAHPGRYSYSALQFKQLFNQFKDLGGEGIEVVTGSHSQEQYHEYANVARNYGFKASQGSDYHGLNKSKMDVGKVPPLPPNLTPIWHDLV